MSLTNGEKMDEWKKLQLPSKYIFDCGIRDGNKSEGKCSVSDNENHGWATASANDKRVSIKMRMSIVCWK